MKVEYTSNNSGGSWWLDDEDWYALERAGWVVHWKEGKTDLSGRPYPDGRWLGALATSAHREGLSLKDAILEWENITGECASDLGCSCCGTLITSALNMTMAPLRITHLSIQNGQRGIGNE